MEPTWADLLEIYKEQAKEKLVMVGLLAVLCDTESEEEDSEEDDEELEEEDEA